jgi:hypothetical protein
LKDYPDAIDAYAKARSIAPANATYAALYIESTLQNGDKTTAQSLVDQFAKVFPNQSSLLASLKQELQNGAAPAITTATPTTAAETTPAKTPTVKKK